jgi:hypothetical protein
MNGEIFRFSVRSIVSSLWYGAAMAALVGLAVYAVITKENADVHVLGIVTLVTLATGSLLLGPEWDSGILQLRLTRPIRVADYVVSRFLGVFAAVASAIVVPTALQIAAALLLRRGDAAALLATIPNRLVESMMALALLAFFGSFTRSFQNVLLYVVALAAVRLAEITDVSRASMRAPVDLLRDALFPRLPFEYVDWPQLIAVASNAAIVLFLAALVASRREVPYE